MVPPTPYSLIHTALAIGFCESPELVPFDHAVTTAFSRQDSWSPTPGLAAIAAELVRFPRRIPRGPAMPAPHH